MGNERFFRKKQTGHKSYDYIRVGKNPFVALATVLIDSILPSNSLNELSLKKIIDQLYHYFPEYIPKQPYLTLHDRITVFLQHKRKSQLIVDLAYVLQQLTINRLLKDPINLNYRSIFCDLTADLPQDYLQQQTSILPYNIFYAAAIELNLCIILHDTEVGKNLRKRHLYTGTTEQARPPEVVMLTQNDDYFCIVKNKSDWAYSEQILTCIAKPINTIAQSSITLSNALELIAANDEELLLSYKQLQKSISSMVDADELNKDKLIALYCEFLPEADDTTHTFLQREQTNYHPNTDNSIEQQLTDFLAGAVATHNIDAHVFMDCLEQVGSKSHILNNS